VWWKCCDIVKGSRVPFPSLSVFRYDTASNGNSDLLLLHSTPCEEQRIEHHKALLRSMIGLFDF
jgi:hypothetical protein